MKIHVACAGYQLDLKFHKSWWSTELLADGEDPVRYLGPTLRLNVYEQDPYR